MCKRDRQIERVCMRVCVFFYAYFVRASECIMIEHIKKTKKTSKIHKMGMGVNGYL